MEAPKTYFGLTLDPLHIGTGGYRLGRVDNTIVRDPGTDLPKVPGSSISGVCRNYAIYRLNGNERTTAENCAKNQNKKIRNNCGKCVICNTFGYALGETGAAANGRLNHIGLVKFFDAMIFAFPVATMCGPVWITTAGLFRNRGGEITIEPEESSLITAFEVPGNRLNLGWLHLPAKKESLTLPPEVGSGPQIEEIERRLVVVHPNLFSEVVNSNLEVRTSVAINFETGAAEKGALFTYEAIPRGSILAFDTVVDKYRCSENISADWLRNIVESGLTLFEVMGLGGMNTRGFGRMKVLNIEGDLK